MTTESGFIVAVNHRGDFIVGSDTRTVIISKNQKQKEVDNNGVELKDDKIFAVHHCVVVHAGNRHLGLAVKLEVKKMLEKREEDGLPVLDSEKTSEAFEMAVRSELKRITIKDGEFISSVLVICCYDENIPKLVLVETDTRRDNPVVVRKINEKWAMGGDIPESVYPKLSDYMNDSFDDDVSIALAARRVNVCTRMAASYSELYTKEGDDISIGGDSIVWMVQDVREIPIKEIGSTFKY